MSPAADAIIQDLGNELWFSVASIWEVAIKRALDRPDFRTDPGVLRAGLLANGYRELSVEGRHVLPLTSLPPLHGDPFDRILISQAMAEGLVLVTTDRRVSEYGGTIRLV